MQKEGRNGEGKTHGKQNEIKIEEKSFDDKNVGKFYQKGLNDVQ
jgi:hypothetical protein